MSKFAQLICAIWKWVTTAFQDDDRAKVNGSFRLLPRRNHQSALESLEWNPSVSASSAVVVAAAAASGADDVVADAENYGGPRLKKGPRMTAVILCDRVGK